MSQSPLIDVDMSEFLEHHGVRGMRWGVRRASKNTPTAANTVSTNPNFKIHKVSDSGRKTADGKPIFDVQVKRVHDPKLMSDEHLQQVIKRLEMEKRFKDLTKEPEVVKQISTGKAVRNRILKTVGDAALEAGKTVVKKQIQSGLENALGIPAKGGGKGKKGKKGKKTKLKDIQVWKP